MSKTYKISGMDCPACATLLECELEDAGIAAKVNFARETLETEEPNGEAKIKQIAKNLGYSLYDQKN